MKNGLLVHIVPRMRDMLFATIFIAVFMLGSRILNVDGDLGLHLTMGSYIIESSSIPTEDIFSHTKAGETRPPHEWGGELLFALIHRLGGLDAIVLLSAVVIASAITLLFTQAVSRSSWPVSSLILTILAALASSVHWLPRPHLFTFVLFIIWVELLEKIRTGTNIPIWIFPIFTAGWANLHAGFIFGLLAWSAYLAGWIYESMWLRQSESSLIGGKLVAVGLLSASASLFTPSGLENWQAILTNGNAYLLTHTLETMPPDLRSPVYWLFLFLLVLFLGCSVFTKPPAAHVFMGIGFGILGLRIARVIPLSVFAITPILAVAVRHRFSMVHVYGKFEERINNMQSSLRGAIWPITVFFGAICAIGINYFNSGNSFFRFDEAVFPIHAIEWLKAHPQQGNMFNDINWSGYILYRLWPSQQVFVDSRTDFYGESFLREYEEIITASPGWPGYLEKYKIGWLIIPVGAPLTTALLDQDWKPLYTDSITIIFSSESSP